MEALRKPSTDANHDGKISIEELWVAARGELNEITKKKGITQSPLYVVQGNVLDLKPFDAQRDPSREAGELRLWLTRLSSQTGLDTTILAYCLGAISNLEQFTGAGRKLTEKDQKIIEEIKNVRALEAAFSASVMKDTLESKIKGLTQ